MDSSERTEGSGEKQSLAYGSTKSPAEHHESTLRAGKRTEGEAGDEILPISQYLAAPAKILAERGFLLSGFTQ